MTIMAPLGLLLGGHYTRLRKKRGWRCRCGPIRGGTQTEWERHNIQSSGYARCHDRQTAIQVQWVSLLVAKKKWREWMIKDGTGQRKIEQGTNEDTGGLLWVTCYHQGEQWLFVVLLKPGFSTCHFILLLCSYFCFAEILDSNPSAS